MQRRGNLLTSSLASGFIFGFLSGVPILGALNCACCSLILGAGVLTSYLLVKGSDVPISFGRAAAGGLLSGLFAIPVMMITWFAFSVIMGGNLQAEFEQAIDQAAQMSPEAQEAAQMIREFGVTALLVIMVGVCFVFYSIFGIAGGLLGRAIFERRTPQPAAAPGAGTPPPPDARWQGPEGGGPPVNPS
jgi:hypothetical protein